jgi:hypothetical protein
MVLIPAEDKKMISITDHEIGGFDIWCMGTEVPDDKGKKLLEKYGFLIMKKPDTQPVKKGKGTTDKTEQAPVE